VEELLEEQLRESISAFGLHWASFCIETSYDRVLEGQTVANDQLLVPQERRGKEHMHYAMESGAST